MSPRPERRRRLRRLGVVAVVLAAYPAFVLGSVYVHWYRAGFPGGRDGPGDAYRHALASATVAYTGSPRWVDWTTTLMERDGRGSDSRAMDAHNNHVGARIGAHARSWIAMQSDVLAAVRGGAVGATAPDRITWLPRERWLDRAY